MMKKLCDLVDVYENNMECVILKVKDNVKMDLLTLGCFSGNEEMFRLTKGKDHTCTVFDKSGNTFSWYWGQSGHTLVSNQLEKTGKLIQSCIEEDLSIYIGSDKKKIQDTLHIRSLKHTEDMVHDIKIMYWESGIGNYTVHKNGEFYKHFPRKDDVFTHFAELGYTVTGGEITRSPQTGCLIEHYEASKRVVEKVLDDSQKETGRTDFDKLKMAYEEIEDFDVAFGSCFYDAFMEDDNLNQSVGRALFRTISNAQNNPEMMKGVNDTILALTGYNLENLVTRLPEYLKEYAINEEELKIIDDLFKEKTGLDFMIEKASDKVSKEEQKHQKKEVGRSWHLCRKCRSVFNETAS